jgi:hypothetical protein
MKASYLLVIHVLQFPYKWKINARDCFPWPNTKTTKCVAAYFFFFFFLVILIWQTFCVEASDNRERAAFRPSHLSL